MNVTQLRDITSKQIGDRIVHVRIPGTNDYALLNADDLRFDVPLGESEHKLNARQDDTTNDTQTHLWDAYEKEYIFDHGWRINDSGKIELTKEQFEKNQYSGKSISDKNVKTLMLPSMHGCCLIFENKHFIIVNN